MGTDGGSSESRESASVTLEIERAAAILRSGGIGGMPTETVYGLAADLFQPAALARVFEVKGRPRFDPLIAHLPTVEWIERVCTEFPPIAERLARRFWPGPLTLVLPKQPTVPDLATSGLETVAVRVPDHPVARALLRAARTPLAAPSANLFGRISPTTAAHVMDQLGATIDFVLDGGPCRVGVESTIVLVQGDRLALLRPGGATIEEIEDCLGDSPWCAPTSEVSESEAFKGAMLAPGMLRQHYAPRTAMSMVVSLDRLASAPDGMTRPGLKRWGALCFRQPDQSLLEAIEPRLEAVEVLSPAGDLQEAACGFFAALRRLDEMQLDLIVSEEFPNRGLGRALNDRLRRATAAG